MKSQPELTWVIAVASLLMFFGLLWASETGQLPANPVVYLFTTLAYFILTTIYLVAIYFGLPSRKG